MILLRPPTSPLCPRYSLFPIKPSFSEVIILFHVPLQDSHNITPYVLMLVSSDPVQFGHTLWSRVPSVCALVQNENAYPLCNRHEYSR